MTWKITEQIDGWALYKRDNFGTWNSVASPPVGRRIWPGQNKFANKALAEKYMKIKIKETSTYIIDTKHYHYDDFGKLINENNT